jgi:type I restriction enzyme S subunit
MSFPSYPAYKPSGVEWLGEVPEHWGVIALKHGYEVTLGKMLQPEAVSEDDELLPYLRAANIHWHGINDSDIKTMWFSKRDRKNLRLQAGDLLVSEGGDVGRSAIWKGEISECYFQNSVNRVRPSNGNLTPFLYYWMLTMKDKGFIDVVCNKSTIAHFTAEKVGAVPVPLPPLGEQQAIANFLDRETAKIDALIAEQQRLIELLQEKRQAVISHAVTKGLNPSAPMKDSGVEWLGEVPGHWEVKNIRMATERITYGFTNPMPTEDSGPYMLTANDIDNGRIRFETCRRTSEHAFSRDLTDKSRPADGDVLLTKDGTLGRVALFVEQDEPACINQSVALLRPNASVCSGSFLAAALMSDCYQEKMLFDAGGTTIKHIYISRLAKMVVALPPLSEQEDILLGLEDKIRPYELLITDSRASLILLKERRSALISAAVTGQIDVRGLV